MSGLFDGKQLKDKSVSPEKLKEEYLQTSGGTITGKLEINGEAWYNGNEVATVDQVNEKADQSDTYTKEEIDEIASQKQNNLIAGDNITIDGVTISSSTPIALSDEVLTYDVAGLKANLSVLVEGNEIKIVGKQNEDGEPIVIGHFNVLQSQIIDRVEIKDGHLFITFIVDGDPGTETVDIDLSEFIDVYVGSQYVGVEGNTVSLKYEILHDKLLSDNFAKKTDIPANAETADKLKTPRSLWGQPFDGSANVAGSISNTGNVTPASNNVSDIGSSGSKYNTVYASTFKGTLDGNATTATTLQTSRTIQLTGAVTGIGSFNGGANATISTSSTTLATKEELQNNISTLKKEVDVNTGNIATNKTNIDNLNKRIITTGTGSKFLSDNGSYKDIQDITSEMKESSKWTYCDFLSTPSCNQVRWRTVGDKLEIIGEVTFGSNMSNITITNISLECLKRIVINEHIIGIQSDSTSNITMQKFTTAIDVSKKTLILTPAISISSNNTIVFNQSIPLNPFALNVQSKDIKLAAVDMVYVNNKFVTVGLYGEYGWSTDGMNWEKGTVGLSNELKRIIYANNMFIAITGNYGHINHNYAYSTDGISWKTGSIELGSPLDITYGNGKFLVLIWGNKYVYSADGINWSNADIPLFGSNAFCKCISYGNGRFIIGSDYGHIFSSVDGINWTYNANRLSGILVPKRIVYKNNKFMLIGDTRMFAQSIDGINWEVQNTYLKMNSSIDLLADIDYGDGVILAVSNQGNCTYSTNGIDWFEHNLLHTSYMNIHSIAYGDGKFIVAGYSNYRIFTK